jgi:hypothetical protein
VKTHLATDEAAKRLRSSSGAATNWPAPGRVKGGSLKVFKVPGLPGEDRYRRLIEEDGTPVLNDKLARQDRERQRGRILCQANLVSADRQGNAAA